MSDAHDILTTEQQLPARQDGATIHQVPIPNYSGAQLDERLVEPWLARKAPSTRRKYVEDLGKFFDFTEAKPLAAITLSDLSDFAVGRRCEGGAACHR